MPKRKSTAAAETTVADTPLRRSLRNTQASSVYADAKQVEKRTPPKRSRKAAPEGVQSSDPAASDADPEPPVKKGRTAKQQVAPKTKVPAEKSSGKAKTNGASVSAQENGKSASEKTYWLLKAEPDTRLENGVDVKFSIDDLAAKTKPEPWDGIRAYPARNNLRSMKKGDLAFFYHSNCKEPGIVGTMEIVQEHSPDLSAHDPKAPYYDASSKPSDPKWSVVHVEFRSKFAVPITLKELRVMGGPGKPLENMQMLKQSRLSVSKVSASEWEYLMGVAEEKAAA